MSTNPRDPKNKSKTASKTATKAAPKTQSLLEQRLNLYPPDLPRKYMEVSTDHGAIITRAMAKEFLDGKLTNQRQVSSTHVNTLAAKMKAGSWRATAQGLIFDWYGRLIDGQHRLTAFLATPAKKFPTLKMSITTGCDPADFIDLDEDSSPRQIKHLLSTGKVPRPHAAATAYRQCLDFAETQEAVLEGAPRGHISFGHRTANNFKNNRRQVTDWILQHEALINHITERTAPKEMGVLRPIALFAGFYLWVALEDQVQADAFFTALITGADLKTTSPIYVLRREFEKLSTEDQVAAKTMDFARGAMIIRAWNAWKAGEKLTAREMKMGAKDPWPMRPDAQPVR